MIRATTLRTLGELWAIGLGLGIVVAALTLRGGRAPMPISFGLSIIFAAGAIFMVVWGVRVKRRRSPGNPDGRPLDPLHAARVVVLAQACSRCGSVFSGLFLSLSAINYTTGSTGYVAEQVLWGGLAAVGAFFLAAASWWAETRCIVDFDDDDHPGAATGAAGA